MQHKKNLLYNRKREEYNKKAGEIDEVFTISSLMLQHI